MATLEQILATVVRIEEKQQASLEVQSNTSIAVARLTDEVMGAKDEKSLRSVVDKLNSFEAVEHRIFKALAAAVGTALIAIIGIVLKVS